MPLTDERLEHTALYHLSAVSVFIFDQHLRLVALYGPELATRFGLDPMACVGRHLFEFSSSRNYAATSSFYDNVLRGTPGAIIVERDGVRLKLSAVPVRWDNGEVCGLVSTVIDIGDLAFLPSPVIDADRASAVLPALPSGRITPI